MSQQNEEILADVGTSKDGPYKRPRIMGYECHAIAQALGFDKGFRRLVIEFDVDEPVRVYFTSFVDKKT